MNLNAGDSLPHSSTLSPYQPHGFLSHGVATMTRTAAPNSNAETPHNRDLAIMDYTLNDFIHAGNQTHGVYIS